MSLVRRRQAPQLDFLPPKIASLQALETLGLGVPDTKLHDGLQRSSGVRDLSAPSAHCWTSALEFALSSGCPRRGPSRAGPGSPRPLPGSLLRCGRGGPGAPPHSRPLKPSRQQAPVPEGSCCLSRKPHLHWPAGRRPAVALRARRTSPRGAPAAHRHPPPGASHQVSQPQTYLKGPEFPGLPEDARATSRDLGAVVRGHTAPHSAPLLLYQGLPQGDEQGDSPGLGHLRRCWP